MSLVGLIAGSGLGAFATIKKGDAISDAYKREAALLEHEAIQAELQSRYVQELIAAKGEKLKGIQNTTYVKSGVALGFGSTLTTLQETSNQISKEIMAVHLEGRRIQERLIRQAAMKRTAASDVEEGAILSAMSGLFGSATSYGMQKG